MTLPESIEVINRRLMDYFGKFENGSANWRVVWSDDQIEKRRTNRTATGIELLHEIVMEVPKYNYIHHKYVLEKLVPVPPQNTELIDKVSYEPVWTFEDRNGNPLPPIWDAILILVTTIYYNIAMADHKAPEVMPEDQMQTPEAIQHRIDKLQELLFGNESEIGDALGRDSAVGYGTRKRNDWLN